MHRPLPDGRARDHSRARPRRLTCLCVAAPVSKASVIAVLVNPKFSAAEVRVIGARTAANTLGFQLSVIYASNENEIDTAFATIAEGRAGALLVASDPFFLGQREQLVTLAARYAMPVVYFSREFECCRCREIGETHPPGMLAIRHDHPAALGAWLRRKLGWRGIGGRGGAAMKARIGSFLIWTFLSPQQSHHSNDGRGHAANQHPYCLVGR